MAFYFSINYFVIYFISFVDVSFCMQLIALTIVYLAILCSILQQKPSFILNSTARCVKITYDHCLLCDRCHLKGGQCSQAGLDDAFTVETIVFTKSAVNNKVNT